MAFKTILILLALTLSTQAAHILVDPGHGGRDVGAVVGPLKEAEVVWPWALALKKELTQLGFKVTLSRSETKTPKHETRVQQLKSSDFDLVISLHANYIQNPQVKGLEYYILNPLSLEDQTLQLASEEMKMQDSTTSNRKIHVNTILADLKKQALAKESLRAALALQKKWPGRIKQGPFEVLSNSSAPAVLVELGFLSSPVDQKTLTNPDFITQQSRIMADGIQALFKMKSLGSF